MRTFQERGRQKTYRLRASSFYPRREPNSLFCTMMPLFEPNSLFCTANTDKSLIYEQNSLMCTIFLHILEIYRAHQAFWLIFRYFTRFCRAFQQILPTISEVFRVCRASRRIWNSETGNSGEIVHFREFGTSQTRSRHLTRCVCIYSPIIIQGDIFPNDYARRAVKDHTRNIRLPCGLFRLYPGKKVQAPFFIYPLRILSC